MFTPEERDQLRAELLEQAVADHRISGAAITGSAAAGRQDRWSDIDLAFGVAEASQLPEVLADWTAHMYGRRRAVHHMDVRAGAWVYRVFLLADTLQVDLAFVPAAEFRALAPTFRLVSGEAQDARPTPPPDPAGLAGLAWLYALHVRSSIARGMLWQALHMIGGVREQALAMACVRHGLAAAHARGVDQLPREATAPFEDSLVRQLDAVELSRAFRVVVAGLMGEIRAADRDLAKRLDDPFRQLTEISLEASGASGCGAIGPGTYSFTVSRIGPESDVVLRNLLQYYIHDMAGWFGIDTNADGSYPYDTSRVWNDGHEAYLAKTGDSIAGFALVGREENGFLGGTGAHDVHEFFILRRFRRHGFGERMAMLLWREHPGEWLVRVLEANAAAVLFWRTAIAHYADGSYTEDRRTVSGRPWVFFRFLSGSECSGQQITS